MRRRTEPTGRFTVGDKQLPVLGAAVAYAAAQAMQRTESGTLYVREIGVERAHYRVDKHADKTVTVTPIGA